MAKRGAIADPRTWDFNEWGTAYASQARIYAPNIWYRNAEGTLLEPQQGHNYEADVKGSVFEGRLDASPALIPGTWTRFRPHVSGGVTR